MIIFVPFVTALFAINHLRFVVISFFRLFLCCAVSVSGCLVAGDEVPGRQLLKPVLLVNGTVHTGTGEILENCSVLMVNGLIRGVGSSLSAPADAIVVDCRGKHVYPGFIAPYSLVGLSEIDAVRATRDFAETGTYNPNLRGETAYNPDSDIIPTVRSNGILISNATPASGTIAGFSSLMRLDGWNREDAGIVPRAALLLNLPSMNVTTAPWIKEPAADQLKRSRDEISELEKFLDDALSYSTLFSKGASTPLLDLRMQAMIPVLKGEVPVLVQANSLRQIHYALSLISRYGLRVVLVGANEIEFVVDEVARLGVAVILNRTHRLPTADGDGYDSPYALPALLVRKGILFSFSESGSWPQRNLPFNAGTAIAYGLSPIEALKAVTINAARILGIADQYGSIEVGKSATLFVSNGNALDVRSNLVTNAWIDGRPVDLSNHHVRMARKYRFRYQANTDPDR